MYYLPTIQQYILQGVSPFEMMFGCPPVQTPFPTRTTYDAVSYQSQLRTKRAQLSDFVEIQLAQAAHKQKSAYDQHTQQQAFEIDQPVWLSSPTAGKPDAKWEGGWKIKAIQGPTTYTITDGRRTKTVHVNRLRIQTQFTSDSTTSPWEAPSIEHEVIDTETPPTNQRYPTRNRRPPDRLTF